MQNIDIDKVLNANPYKVLLMAYQKMASNYNEASAKEFNETCKQMPLQVILDKAEAIMSEPYYGTKFYSDIVTNPKLCIFARYNDQLEKINRVIQDASKENLQQAELLQETKQKVEALIGGCQNSIQMAEELYTKAPEIEQGISEHMYRNHPTDAIGVIQSQVVPCREAFLLYSPHVAKAAGDSYFISEEVGKYFKEYTEEELVYGDNWKRYMGTIIDASRLGNDTMYREAVNNIPAFPQRVVMKGLMEESVKEQIDELLTQRLSGLDDINAVTGFMAQESAIDKLFEIDDTFEFEKANTDRFDLVEIREMKKDSLYYLLEKVCDDVDIRGLKGNVSTMNYFTEGTTVDAAFINLSNEILALEAKEEDSENEDDVEDESDTLDRVSPTPEKPEKLKKEKKSLTEQVTNKALDVDAKAQKGFAKAGQKVEQLKSAGKAITQIPNQIKEMILDLGAQWDKADDERRKKYIQKPGFRKKIFKNLKLSIMYYSVASAKITMLPLVFMVRKFSKDKDVRVKNELAREIETEIKICDEKLSDANSSDDKQAKYELMRIKSQLEAELLRVKTNSKYV